jgi:hypothetical protein
MANAIPALGSQTNLKSIFRTLQNQTGAIFRGEHNAQSVSITTCLENLGQLILKDGGDYLEELGSFIGNGVFQISGHYGSGNVTPTVLNFLMTAIRSYNHIISCRETQYRVALDTCQGLSEIGNAFLTQVLIPYIDAGALHVFPPDDPLVFDLKVEEKAFIIRSPSPLVGHRPGSLVPSVSFGQEFTKRRRERRKARRAAAAKLGQAAFNSNSSATGSSSEGDGGGGTNGGRRKNTKRLKSLKNVPRRSIRRANK